MKRLYDTKRWRRLRKRILNRDPLCVLCLRAGIDGVPATVADHITPHDGDPELMWDEDNLQGICATCHSGIKRLTDNHGHSAACCVDGMPLDGGHWWRK